MPRYPLLSPRLPCRRTWRSSCLLQPTLVAAPWSSKSPTVMTDPPGHLVLDSYATLQELLAVWVQLDIVSSTPRSHHSSRQRGGMPRSAQQCRRLAHHPWCTATPPPLRTMAHASSHDQNGLHKIDLKVKWALYKVLVGPQPTLLLLEGSATVRSALAQTLALVLLPGN